ncbi:MAG: glycosyltransferase family 2 protein, partial [Gammaproteobacteria bacterium]
MKISIVVPVRNEAGNILPLLQEIDNAMNQAEAYEIIYVDDGSEDGTLSELRLAMKRFENLRVIRHQRSCGQSTAIYNGVKAAIHPWIATLDGDGQNDPADIPRLYESLQLKRKTSADLWMAVGWRNNRHDSRWRRFSSRLANAVRAGLLRDNTPDTGCGLKIFIRDRFLELPFFDHMHRFLPALILRAGGRVVSEPVNHRART